MVEDLIEKHYDTGKSINKLYCDDKVIINLGNNLVLHNRMKYFKIIQGYLTLCEVYGTVVQTFSPKSCPLWSLIIMWINWTCLIYIFNWMRSVKMRFKMDLGLKQTQTHH